MAAGAGHVIVGVAGELGGGVEEPPPPPQPFKTGTRQINPSRNRRARFIFGKHSYSGPFEYPYAEFLSAHELSQRNRLFESYVRLPRTWMRSQTRPKLHICPDLWQYAVVTVTGHSYGRMSPEVRSRTADVLILMCKNPKSERIWATRSYLFWGRGLSFAAAAKCGKRYQQHPSIRTAEGVSGEAAGLFCPAVIAKDTATWERL